MHIPPFQAKSFLLISFLLGLPTVGPVAQAQDVVPDRLFDLTDSEERNIDMPPLYGASLRGDLEAVKRCVAGGVHPSAMMWQIQESERANAVAAAASRSQIKVVEWFLTQGIIQIDDAATMACDDVVNPQNPREQATILHIACRYGQMEMAKWLLEHGAKVDVVTGGGITPLFDAALSGNEAMVKLLLDYHADINHLDDWHRTALGAAVRCGHPASVRVLVEAGIDRRERAIPGSRVWDEVVRMGDRTNQMDIVDILLTHGFAPDPSDFWVRKILIQAICRDNAPLVKKLLGMGIPLPGPKEATASASRYDFGLSMAHLLLDHGADAQAFPGISKSLIRDAARRGDLKGLEKLMKQGFELFPEALLDAAHAGQLDMVHVLIEMGLDPIWSDPWNKDMQGVNAAEAAASAETDVVLAYFLKEEIADAGNPRLLCAAAASGRLANIKRLIKAGADVDDPRQTPHRCAPLYCAAENGHAQAVTALIAAGADPRATDERGNTALMCAAENGHAQAVAALIAAGADPLATNERGNTALMLAKKNKHAEVVKLLLK